eukprot:1157627-Pelagomonas_calceolata.AAC.3
MSNDDNPNKKARVHKGKSDGAYKLKLGAVGPTNKFQAKWVKETPADGQPHREHWLVDEGACEDGQLMAGCSLCDVTFQCRQTVKSHENSSNRQKRSTARMLKQKDKADWQARFGKAAECKAL